MDDDRIRRPLFLLALTACALPVAGPPAALAGGIIFSLFPGNPWPTQSARWSKRLLQGSVVGLGFGLGLGEVWSAGRHAVLFTLAGIVLTLAAGRILGCCFGTDATTSDLIAFGTAICGGSAIAAMAPVLKARDEEVAVALGTVFTLNAAALFLFPVLGRLAGLGEREFGLWAALAIHDTSSVVGAAAAYGGAALAVGTTVKLARTVWIVPCALSAAWLRRSEGRVSFPWFILGFLGAAALRSLLPGFDAAWDLLTAMARRMLVVTLFLIGAVLSRKALGDVGLRPLAQGAVLWLAVSATTFGAIRLGWISLH